MRLLGFLQIIFFVVGLSFPAYSQQFERLLRDFDSNALTQADKRFSANSACFRRRLHRSVRRGMGATKPKSDGAILAA